MSQLFGLFPISGVGDLTPETLEFRSISFRTIYSFIIFLLLSSLLVKSLSAVVEIIMTTSAHCVSSIPGKLNFFFYNYLFI